MFLSRRKNESGRGSKKQFDQKGKKRPRRCMDELNDDTDDDEDHVVTNNRTDAPTFVSRNAVNNFAEMASEFRYCEVKKEAV